MHNAEIAEMFNRLADLLEIEGANPFRVRAYRNAARAVGGMSKSMADLVSQGQDLSELPNIGKDLAEKIATIVKTGTLPLLDEVEERTPSALSDLMKIGGLGPKRVKVLYKQLGIESAEGLKRAAEEGKIRDLEGFGTKTEQMILERLPGARSKEEKRHRLIDAEEIVEPLVGYLKESEGPKGIAVAGSYRRRKETVGDLDILVTAKKGSSIMDRLVEYDEVSDVISHGTTRSTVVLRSGMQVDVRVVPEVSYGAALQYFTGSKAHNIAVRKLAGKKGLKINEYGVFRGDKRVAGKTEHEVYKKVGLRFIEPELREDRGEIEAARKGRLPGLVTLEDMRGDLHCHTNATDGHDSLEKMVRGAAELGLDYIAICDHSKHLTVANGLDEKRLLKQIKAIDSLQEKFDQIGILKSIELDILTDGTLDLPDDVLKELDLTVCAVHYKFNLTRKQQTERIIRAMDNPHFNILAHPTGRMIGEREPYEVDLEKVIEAAAERGCFLEVNAHPERLDLTDDGCKLAKDTGVKVAISTDAHSTADLELMRYGVGQARRGWLEPNDVINTRSWRELKKLLKRT